MLITFSTCFYIVNSKFRPQVYGEWIKNFLLIVNNFNLVLYTDENSLKFMNESNIGNIIKNNPKIKVVIKRLEEFYNYRYKEQWINNHSKNVLLNSRTGWELNMIWAEKISFVNETVNKQYFDTEFYGWCDIGYFRNRCNPKDTHTSELTDWPNDEKILAFDKDKIFYARVNNNDSFVNSLISCVKSKNEKGLPTTPIPQDQVSIAGGFFILHKKMMNWWFKTFDNKLKLYFDNNYLVKDDQIIIVDCVFSNQESFSLSRENDSYDIWFMFQRLLK